MSNHLFKCRCVKALFVIMTCMEAFVSANPSARSFALMNNSGHRVEVYWMHVQTNELVIQSSPHVYNGATFNLNSFVGHKFELRELPGQKSGECGRKDSDDKSCRVNYLTVSENEDQVYTLDEDFVIEVKDNMSRAIEEAQDSTEECKKRSMTMVSKPNLSPELATSAIHLLMACVEESVTQRILKADEEIKFQAEIRTQMGAQLENYTCADPTVNTSEPISTHIFNDRSSRMKVNVLHERRRSKILLVNDFISEVECKAMQDAAKSQLHSATVAAPDGGSQFSSSRKAMQAGISVPWAKEGEGHPIAVLSRRVYDFTNHATPFKIDERGQEDLMSIQYFGRGEDDEEPDRYTPHCDGECTGLPFRPGTRFATMVMYCDMPEVGGMTNFRNAGVHVKPKAGDAVFFTYLGEDQIMDKGFTEHSGCPVYVGTKRIVTQWMRLGVDDANPWHSFNTLGVKHDAVNND